MFVEGVYVTEYYFRIIKAFGIFTEKGVLNDYWIVWVFLIISVFGM